MKKIKGIISFILVFVMSISFITACSQSSEQQPAPSQSSVPSEVSAPSESTGAITRDTLIVADRREAKTLNPYASNDTGTSSVTCLIYDTLVEFDENMQLQPSLATSWEKIDDTHYRFDLRDDVYFHNGDKFSAQDVLDSFALSTVSPAAQSLIGVVDVENSKVLSEYSVELALKEPFGPFLNNMALSIAGIVNKRAIEEGGDNYDENPVGTGPFIFKSWRSGDALELTANENYWGGSINFKNLVIRQIPEATTRVVEVETGGVDIALGITDNDTKELMDNADVNLITKNILNTNYLSFNCTKEPFNDPRIRQAIAYALDVPTIVQNSTFGIGERSFSPISPDVFGYYNAGDLYAYNIEKAKELLTEAGYPDGFSTALTTNSSEMIGEMAQSMLGQIGITVEIKQLDFANWLDELLTGKQEMYIGGWTVPSGDAFEGLDAFHSSNHGSGGNRSYYTNEELDTILDNAKSEMDSEKRLALYKEAQEIIAAESIYVNLYVGHTTVATTPAIENLRVLPSQHIDYSKIIFTE